MLVLHKWVFGSSVGNPVGECGNYGNNGLFGQEIVMNTMIFKNIYPAVVLHGLLLPFVPTRRAGELSSTRAHLSGVKFRAVTCPRP